MKLALSTSTARHKNKTTRFQVGRPKMLSSPPNPTNWALRRGAFEHCLMLPNDGSTNFTKPRCSQQHQQLVARTPAVAQQQWRKGKGGPKRRSKPPNACLPQQKPCLSCTHIPTLLGAPAKESFNGNGNSNTPNAWSTN